MDPWSIAEGTWHHADDGEWWVRPPGMPVATRLHPQHAVTELDGGAITVAPSILIELGDGRRWHGYLEAGRWRRLEDSTVG